MSLLHQRGHAKIHGNLTPMIDMIFLLIVFFVLVSRIVDRERVEMNLPQPTDGATVRADQEQRIVINVMPGFRGEVRGYRMGATDFPADRAGLAALADHLGAAYRANPLLNINLRADRSTHYEHVEPVMQAISSAARSAGGPPGAGAIPQARVNLIVTQEH